MQVSSGGARGDLQSALVRVARHAHAQFGEATGVGATLMVADRALFAASNAFTDAVDVLQYGLGEGPCLTAVATQEVVWSGSIGAGEVRWPRFTAGAGGLELGSALSAPVLSDGEAIGSLNLYARTHNTFGDDDRVAISRVADAVAEQLGTLHLRAVADAASKELATTLDDLAVVQIGVGILMERYNLRSRHARVLLAQVARQDSLSEASAARVLIGGDGHA